MSAQQPLKHLEGLEMARYMYSVCCLGLTYNNNNAGIYIALLPKAQSALQHFCGGLWQTAYFRRKLQPRSSYWVHIARLVDVAVGVVDSILQMDM